MRVTRSPRSFAALAIAVLAAATLTACGGGGGGGTGGNGGGSGGGNSPTPVRTTPRGGTLTPTTPPTVLEDTPTPTPVVVLSGSSILDAIRRAPGGSTVIVAPGSYQPVVLSAGDVQGDIRVVADITGNLTETAPAPVLISVRNAERAAFEMNNVSGLTIDGFTLRGGTEAGILITDSSAISVRNCVISRGTGDGITFQRSPDGLVFDNLIFNNDGSGIALLGSSSARVVNNTAYGNSQGIFIGTDDAGQQASSGAFLRNNIFNKNDPGDGSAGGIIVDSGDPSSLDGFDSDYNLNTDGSDGPDAGRHDIADPNTDPLFLSVGSESGFRLERSLAGSGTSPAIDAGDPSTDPDLAAELETRTTQSDRSPDAPPVDQGYHNPDAILATPTPRATRTRAPTVRLTPTPTGPTRTPTRTATIGTPQPTTTPTVTVTPTPAKTATPTRTPITPRH